MLDNYKNPNKALPDMDFFEKYPSPIFEAMFNQHVSMINTTTTHHGPLLYWLCRDIEAFKVVEIGLAQGWSSFFMASACKDNAVRHGHNSMYYGVDIADKSELIKAINDRGVPAKLVQKNSLDCVHSDFDNEMLELVFIDGWHSTGHVLKEMEIFYPMLKGGGAGYYVMHDVYAWCEDAFKEVRKRYPNDECIRFLQNYGLAIFRKMEGYDHNKIYWPDGAQKPEFPIVPGSFESNEEKARRIVQ